MQSTDGLEGFPDTLASPSFSRVTTLKVQCNGLMGHPPPFHHSFERFLVHFDSVTTLHVREQDIYILMKHIITDSLSENVLFQGLRHLVIFEFDYIGVSFFECKCRYHPGPASGSIQQFLRLRKQLGMPPIQDLTVDLTTAEYQTKDSRPALNIDPALDSFFGINIVWKVDERMVYIRDCEKQAE
ncbi:hypothetical protein JR316_0005328 [Psilocybe cubensis]|uniref:Uncharacterized protein n=2 Tax=Psilocybe cubensis TaxID=181762 RepID=A0ACB8H675_PSICU|nr:hypothetical protein JR316_0005328 [Psilocybe cubensis]KAH9483224.1 hypothetical protein JR316_0005328 [Psilocybe cubensis]